MINFSGQDLTLIATALANELSKGKTADEAALLGSLISMIGDAVAVISAKKSIEETSQKNNDNKMNELKK